MQQHVFESHAEYVRSQEELTGLKIRNHMRRCFTTAAVAQAIRDLHETPVSRGLCHGVRDGKELKLFETACGGTWIGTEIVGQLCDGVRIIHQDFTHVPDEWVGAMDVIYSNSLDHAYDPWKAVKAWLCCLSRDGRLYVEWTPWHAKLGRHYKADCFAASRDEYRELLSAAGRVEREVTVPEEKFDRVIFSLR